MKNNKSISINIRVLHRYLGFFLAGIMAVYAISGVVLIFRDTDFLKKEKQIEKEIAANLKAEELAETLRIRGFKIEKEEGDLVHFNSGTYNKKTGLVIYTTKELPVIMEKLTHLHKASTGHPLYFLNIFFGLSLLFFVVSSFWMFMPKTKIFKKGLYYTAGGLVITLILLFV